MKLEPGQQLLHYRLVGKIGEGGMGEVWRAEDTRLGREVAIKLLHGEVVADEGRRSRFEQEARAVAALSHPGIVTLFAIEEADGLPFLVLEHIDGKPLDEAPIGASLSWPRLLEIAKSVVDAVAAAHTEGIVHRDLKPENVLLASDGRVKVLDFGLAKLRDDSPLIVGDGSASPTMTQAGTLLGTLAYMSPEQAQGRPVDARSDVFSLGILLHLLATGKHPFPGEHPISIISSIVKDRPPALHAVRPELPGEFGRLLERCLEKDPQRRFASAVELRDALEAMPTESRRRPRRNGKLAAVGVATLALVGVAGWFALQRRPAAPAAPAATASVAILPFQHSDEAIDAEFALGIHDDLINQVSRVGTLKVISRTSVMALPAGQLTISQIGDKLAVGAVMEGSVRRAGDQIRVNVNLIDARSEKHLWGSSYDRAFTAQNVFAIQSEIALEVAAALRVTLSPTEQRTLESAPTDNIGALEAFRLARTAARGQPSSEQIRERVRHLERAVALDPGFAQAWAALSTAHLHLYWRGIDRTPGRLEASLEALQTAASLRPELPEVAMARGFYFYWGFRKYAEALAEFVTAEQGLPNNADLLAAQAFIQRRLGRWEESLALLDRAIELDPLNVYLAYNRATTLLTMRRYDDAAGTAKRLKEIDPEGPWDTLLESVFFFKTGVASGFIDATLSRPATFDDRLVNLVDALAFEKRNQQALDLLDSTSEELTQGQVHWAPRSLKRAEILSRLGRAEEAREEYAAAERQATAALLDAPEDPRICAALGLARAGLGKAEAAVDAARRAVALVPYEKDAMDAGVYSWNLALVYSRLGQHDEAMRQVGIFLSHPGIYSEAWVRAHPDFAE